MKWMLHRPKLLFHANFFSSFSFCFLRKRWEQTPIHISLRSWSHRRLQEGSILKCSTLHFYLGETIAANWIHKRKKQEWFKWKIIMKAWSVDKCLLLFHLGSYYGESIRANRDLQPTCIKDALIGLPKHIMESQPTYFPPKKACLLERKCSPRNHSI